MPRVEPQLDQGGDLNSTRRVMIKIVRFYISHRLCADGTGTHQFSAWCPRWSIADRVCYGGT